MKLSKSSKLMIGIYVIAIALLIASWCRFSVALAWLSVAFIIGGFLPLFLRISNEEQCSIDWPTKHQRNNLAVDGNDGQEYDDADRTP